MRTKPELTAKDHLLTVSDFDKQDILNILGLIKLLKTAHYQGVDVPLLKGKTLGMMFDQPSTRTRVSFETAMTNLGGHAEYLAMSNLHIGDGHESMRDTAEVISRMVDGLICRTNEQEFIDGLAEYSFVPVINAMSMYLHPTQVICDLFTMTEHLPDTPIEDMVVCIMGDCNIHHKYTPGVPVQRSWMRLAAVMGMTIYQCGPEEMWLPEEDIEFFEKIAEKTGAKLIITDKLEEAIPYADFVVTDSWWYHGFDSQEAIDYRFAALKPYQINQELMNMGKPTLAAMHCLPGNRDVEVTTEVWDGPQSLIFEEAENRLHTEVGLLAWFMTRDETSPELEAHYKGLAEAYIKEAKNN